MHFVLRQDTMMWYCSRQITKTQNLSIYYNDADATYVVNRQRQATHFGIFIMVLPVVFLAPESG
jgi:hypothetical protein